MKNDLNLLRFANYYSIAHSCALISSNLQKCHLRIITLYRQFGILNETMCVPRALVNKLKKIETTDLTRIGIH